MFKLKGPKLNVQIRDKILLMGVAHLTRGGRSCLWALYRSTPCTVAGSEKDFIGKTKKIKNCEDMRRKNLKKEAGNNNQTQLRSPDAT
jgi:hypothetical protein